MPASDYTSTGGGLKLKGAKNAGIDKKKSKKSKRDKPAASTSTPSTSTALAETVSATPDVKDRHEGEEGAQYDREKSRTVGAREGSAKAEAPARMKTEAELRHEEMKRKRLDERLKRDGMKTHKEKVEQLNKYLSGLSEHHDMPRIGPG